MDTIILRKDGKPHGGRIAYPKIYYKIMVSKAIDKELKKKVLSDIRIMHNQRDLYSGTYHPEDTNQSSDFAMQINLLCLWSNTPSGREVWRMVRDQVFRDQVSDYYASK